MEDFNLEDECCGEVDASEFVYLISNHDFDDIGTSSDIINEATLMYMHLVVDKCVGCRNRIGKLLEEYATGNSLFGGNPWKRNLTFIELMYGL